MKDIQRMETHYLIQFSEKNGEIKKVLSGIGRGILKLWALQNPCKGCETIIFCLSDGEVAFYVDKNGHMFSTKDFEEGERNIEDYCPGLLAHFQKYDKQEKSKKRGENV